MSYYGSVDELCKGLGLDLLVRAEATLDALTRHDRLSDYAPDPIASGQLYHRVRDVLGKVRNAVGFQKSVLWMAGPSGTVEQLPWAVGLAEQVSRQGLRVYLVGERFGGWSGTSTRCEELSQDLLQRLGDSLPEDPVAVGTDVEGVRWIVSRTSEMKTPVEAARDDDWSVLFADSIPEWGEPIGPHPADGVIFVTSFRDHSRSELEEICSRLGSPPCLGVVPLGPEADVEGRAPAPLGPRTRSLWDDSRRPEPTEPVAPKIVSHESPPPLAGETGEVTQTSWADLARSRSTEVRKPTNTSPTRPPDPPSIPERYPDGSRSGAEKPAADSAPPVDQTSWGDRIAAKYTPPNSAFRPARPKPEVPASDAKRPDPVPGRPSERTTAEPPQSSASPGERATGESPTPRKLSRREKRRQNRNVQERKLHKIEFVPDAESSTREAKPTQKVVVVPSFPTKDREDSTVQPPPEPAREVAVPETVEHETMAEATSSDAVEHEAIETSVTPESGSSETLAPEPTPGSGPRQDSLVPDEPEDRVLEPEVAEVRAAQPASPGSTAEGASGAERGDLDPFEEAAARHGLASSTGVEVQENRAAQEVPAAASEDRTVALLSMWERENHRRSLPGRIFQRVVTTLIVLAAVAAAGWYGYGYWMARNGAGAPAPSAATPGQSDDPGEPNGPGDADVPGQDPNDETPAIPAGGGQSSSESGSVIPAEGERDPFDTGLESGTADRTGLDLSEVRDRLERRRQAGSVENRVALPAEAQFGGDGILSTPEPQDAAPPLDPQADVAAVRLEESATELDPEADSDEVSGQTEREPALDFAGEDGTVLPEFQESYVIHLSSFRSLEQAQEEVLRLRESSLDPEFLFVEIPGKGTWYRVFIGHFATFVEARDTAVQLRTEMDLGQIYVVGQGGTGTPIPVGAP